MLCTAARQMADIDVPGSVWLRIREQTGHAPRGLRQTLLFKPFWLGVSGLVAAGLMGVILLSGRNRVVRSLDLEG
ncbi:MAG: hypothetical protein ABIK43_02790, partial [candidate division WOR-3 bacterium]